MGMHPERVATQFSNNHAAFIVTNLLSVYIGSPWAFSAAAVIIAGTLTGDSWCAIAFRTCWDQYALGFSGNWDCTGKPGWG